MEESTITCSWCGEEFSPDEVYNTDIGDLCDRCIQAIKSRGETITITY